MYSGGVLCNTCGYGCKVLPFPCSLTALYIEGGRVSVHKDIRRLSEAIVAERAVFDAVPKHRSYGGYRIIASISLHNIFERTFEMAKKIAAAKGKEKKKAEFAGFANVELTVEEKAEAKAWIQDVEKVQVEIDEMAASLYKISFFKSEATGGYQATAFCADNESVNAGYILSSFAPHWWDAIAMLAYKHAIRCEGVWPVDNERGADVWG